MLKTCRGKPYTIEGSTDSGGLSPWLAMDIWGRYADVVDGLEMIAWRGISSWFLNQPDSQTLPITRLHGPLGGDGFGPIDRAKVWLYNYGLLLQDQGLLPLAQRHSVSVLVHEPHASNGFAQSLEVYGTPVGLWVENHARGELGVTQALQTVDSLQQQGHNIQVMFDLAHFSEPAQSEGFHTRWKQMVEQLARLSTDYSVGVHFPVGNLDYDSIPVLDEARVSDQMLVALAQVLPMVNTVVFEYQSPVGDYLSLPAKRKQEVHKRLDQVFNRLERVGII